MNDLIKALKDNEKPFGLMMKGLSNDDDYGDLMEVFARVGKNFQQYDGSMIPGEWRIDELFSLTRDYTNHGITYRLRPDYQKEAEAEKCEVYENSRGVLMFIDSSGHTYIDTAPRNPDFIGYLYEDGTVSPHYRLYVESHTKALLGSVQIEDIEAGLKVLTPTHVLFRKAK